MLQQTACCKHVKGNTVGSTSRRFHADAESKACLISYKRTMMTPEHEARYRGMNVPGRGRLSVELADETGDQSLFANTLGVETLNDCDRLNLKSVDTVKGRRDLKSSAALPESFYYVSTLRLRYGWVDSCVSVRRRWTRLSICI